MQTANPGEWGFGALLAPKGGANDAELVHVHCGRCCLQHDQIVAVNYLGAVLIAQEVHDVF
jgi:hypothetical protein